MHGIPILLYPGSTQSLSSDWGCPATGAMHYYNGSRAWWKVCLKCHTLTPLGCHTATPLRCHTHAPPMTRLQHYSKCPMRQRSGPTLQKVWGLTPQQQPGSYQGGDGEMMRKSVSWWSKPQYPEETTDLRHCRRL